MSTAAIFILLILMVVVLSPSRKVAAIGMIAGALYLTQGAKIELFGINLFAIRLLEVAGLTRIIIRKEYTFFRLNEIDWAFLMLYIYSTIIFLLRSNEGQKYQIGVAVDAILCYFIFRGLFRNIEDFKWFLRVFVIVLLPYSFLLLVERFTHRNPFAIVGAAEKIFAFRDGVPRCVGSFRNPDLLGTLGVSFLPLYIGLSFAETDRVRAFLGVSLCLGIVWFSNSGGPLCTAFIGLLGWLLWFVRTKMSFVRYSIVCVILLLVVFMKAPIWYFPAKISVITGGDGYHRSFLMDVAVKNIDKWWLMGMPIEDTADWFPYIITITGGADITNQYISYGLTAGLIAFGLFIFLLIQAFKKIGKALSAVRLGLSGSRNVEFLLWGLGVMLSVHLVNWLGVTYFDQIYVVWLMQLSVISGILDYYVNAPKSLVF